MNCRIVLLSLISAFLLLAFVVEASAQTRTVGVSVGNTFTYSAIAGLEFKRPKCYASVRPSGTQQDTMVRGCRYSNFWHKHNWTTDKPLQERDRNNLGRLGRRRHWRQREPDNLVHFSQPSPRRFDVHSFAIQHYDDK